MPYSVVVNRNGDRFYDEGEDVWPKRYAIWGRLIAQQPGQIAYSICDAKAFPLFMPSVFPAIKADTLEELAVKMKLDPTKVRETIDSFNKAVKPGQVFDNLKLDGNATEGLTPNKTNWARAVDKPPFYGYPLRPGITFTYLERQGERQGPGPDGERPARRQPVRIRRDHVRQHPRQRLSRGIRHDHRHRIRPHRRPGGSTSCKKLTPS